jgi:hypothetical protein
MRTPKVIAHHTQDAWAASRRDEKLSASDPPLPEGGKVSHSYINRTLSIVHMCALLAVVATLAIVISRVSVDAVNSGVCHGLSPEQLSGNGECATGESRSTPVGYRLP